MRGNADKNWDPTYRRRVFSKALRESDFNGRYALIGRLCLAALAMLALGNASKANDVTELTAEQWRDDIHALVSGLEQNHRDAWNFVSRTEVEQLKEEAARKAGKVSAEAMIVALQQIAASVGDGHTFVAAADFYSSYPIALQWMEGNYYIVQATAEKQALLGTKLVAIDGLPIRGAADKLLKLVPRNENVWHERHMVANLLTQAQPLHEMGVAGSVDEATFTIENADGRRRQIRMTSLAPSNARQALTVGDEGRVIAAEPARGLRLSMFGDVAYLDFASYSGLEETSGGIWNAIDKAGARALVIDFRKNGGGSLPAGRQHIVYAAWQRSQLNREGCLFVLTGPATFSAAMTNVSDLRRETEAIILGLPTGARPNGYQENKWFILPHSGLRVSAAQRRYRFGAPTDIAVMPDIEVGQTIEDWRKGQDTALNVALSRATGCQRLDAREP